MSFWGTFRFALLAYGGCFIFFLSVTVPISFSVGFPLGFRVGGHASAFYDAYELLKKGRIFCNRSGGWRADVLRPPKMVYISWRT